MWRWVVLALDNVTGLYNTAIGNTAGQQITSGTANVAIGHSSLISNQSGQYNVAIGGNSLNSNTASENVGVGLRTLSQNNDRCTKHCYRYKSYGFKFWWYSKRCNRV